MPPGLAFYDMLGKQLAKFPPPAADQPELDKLAAIGVGPGMKPSTDASLSADTVAGDDGAVAAGPASVLADVTAAYVAGFAAHNGYLVPPTGTLRDGLQVPREVTQVGLGALVPEEAIYPLAQVDHTLGAADRSRRGTRCTSRRASCRR